MAQRWTAIALAIGLAAALAPRAAGAKSALAIETEGGRFRAEIGARVQVRYTFERIEAAIGDEYEERSAFSIPRARLILGGNAFLPELTYKFQADFGRGFVYLRDFYVDYAIDPALHVRAGQFKRPFSRQQITSSGKLELVDRSITDAFFDAGRDIGVVFHSSYDKPPPFEWAIGLFNGTGDRPTFAGEVTIPPGDDSGPVAGGTFTNVPRRFLPMLVARLGYNHGGIDPYSEPDLKGGGFRFAVGASGQFAFDFDERHAARLLGELDFILKYRGLSVSGAVFVSSRQDGEDFEDQAYEATGFHAQAGYVIGGVFQPAVRYAHIFPDGDDNDIQEALGGLSVYIFDHGLKWQTDGGAVLRDTRLGRRTDWLVRSQLQLAF